MIFFLSYDNEFLVLDQKADTRISAETGLYKGSQRTFSAKNLLEVSCPTSKKLGKYGMCNMEKGHMFLTASGRQISLDFNGERSLGRHHRFTIAHGSPL